MLELFVFILGLVAAYLFTFAVRDLSGMVFQALADTSKPYEDQKKYLLVLHKVNGVSHYVMIYLKAFASAAFGAWVLWVAIAIR